METGGKEESQQEAIDMKEDGGREESPVNMKTERDCGREEEGWEEAIFTILIHILTAMPEDPRTWTVLHNSPEVNRTAAEADTSWLRGNTGVGLQVLL